MSRRGRSGTYRQDRHRDSCAYKSSFGKFQVNLTCWIESLYMVQYSVCLNEFETRQNQQFQIYKGLYFFHLGIK